MLFCRFHDKRIALVHCHRCGIALCAECQVLLKGTVFCLPCSRDPIPGVTLTPYRSPSKAAICSLLIPGFGQVYNGQFTKGILILLSCWLIFPWIYGVYDAAIVAAMINRRQVATFPSIKEAVLFLLFVASLLVSISPSVVYYLSFNSKADAIKQNLRIVSQASEEYAKDYGRFPVKVSDLYSGDYPYMKEIVCDTEQYGYHFTCDFSAQGYVFAAKPIFQQDEKQITFAVKTGGVFTEQYF